MLNFFRKYQRAFFLVITFFVVISFSFFGTFNAISTMRSQTTTAFTTVDGTVVTRADVDELAMFLATDAEDKIMQGGGWGANFLNDGVVKKDLFETGIAAVLADKFASILEPDLQIRLEKEKRYQGYVHPKAPFLSANAIWSYFAPEVKSKLVQLQNQEKASSPEALKARVALYLAEKRFPEPMLKQVLFYQQKQYASWLPADEMLPHSDLALFGYHHLNDWFGPRFTTLVSEFILNSAAQARLMGYEISREEALADLLRNASLSYQQNRDSPQLGVASNNEYFKLQLQKMNMDQSRAVHLWQQVMLFRRLYHNAGALPLVDRFAFQRFGEFTGQTVAGTMYSLPEALQFNQFNKLQKFEMYLKSVSKKQADPLALPTVFLDLAQVTEQHPELVQKRYILEIASADKRLLQGRVSVQEMWDWEASDAGWKKINEQFPELNSKVEIAQNQRRSAINALDQPAKSKVDAFARSQIVENHPEWLKDALTKAPAVKQEVAISLRDGTTPFAGLKDNKTMIKFLDEAAEGNEEALSRLQQFSADEINYYRIVVLQKPETAEILTFAEASERKLLDPLTETALKGYYVMTREKNPEKYKLSTGEWKSFEEARPEIAADYFAIVLKNIKDDAISAGLISKDMPLSEDQAANLRLYKYMRMQRSEAEKDPNSLQAHVKENQIKDDGKELIWKAAPPLADQWKLKSVSFEEARSAAQSSIDLKEAFALPSNQWSKIATPPNGELSFFQVVSKGEQQDENMIRDKVLEAHSLLKNEAQQILAKELIQQMIDKKAISLNLQSASEGAEMELPGVPIEES